MDTPAVYEGLAQIPLKYLKEELLPKLKDPDFDICLNGSFWDKANEP